jgi:TatD DNase family protein
MEAYQDAHNHLHHPALQPHMERILAAVRTPPVNWMVVNGTAESDWETVAQLSKSFSFVIPSFGLHPWYLTGDRKTGKKACANT